MTDIVHGSLRMMGDRILLKPLDWKPSELIEVVRRGRPVRGEVKAIGPGCYPKRYAPDRSSFKYTKRYQPTVVKVGDIVELGGLGTFDGAGYSFQEVMVGTELHIICTEKDVAGVWDEAHVQDEDHALRVDPALIAANNTLLFILGQMA